MVDNIPHFVQYSLNIKSLTLRRHVKIKWHCVRSRIRFIMRSVDYVSCSLDQHSLDLKVLTFTDDYFTIKCKPEHMIHFGVYLVKRQGSLMSKNLCKKKMVCILQSECKCLRSVDYISFNEILDNG